jgi:hypothetical protein
MRRLGVLPSVLGLALASAFLPSCFALQKGGLFPEDGDQVFLEFFDNKTFYRDLQFILTEQVKSEILSRPGLHLTSKESADLVLGGRIVDVRQRVLSEDPNRQITSERTTITVVMELRDARTGEIIKEARISETGEFVPDFGESLDDAQPDAFRFLAREIVRQLEKDF